MSMYPTMADVEAADLRQLVDWNRNLPSPVGTLEREAIERIVERLAEQRAQDNGAFVAASKSVGW